MPKWSRYLRARSFGRPPRYGLVVLAGTALGLPVAHRWSEYGSVPPSV
jgi:hypothetical protein